MKFKSKHYISSKLSCIFGRILLNDTNGKRGRLIKSEIKIGEKKLERTSLKEKTQMMNILRVVRNIFPDPTKQVISIYLGVFLTIIPVSAGWVLTYLFEICKKEYPTVILVWYFIGGPLCVCISYYMPIYASSDLFTSYLIGSLSSHFKTWSAMFHQTLNEIEGDLNSENG